MVDLYSANSAHNDEAWNNGTLNRSNSHTGVVIQPNHNNKKGTYILHNVNGTISLDPISKFMVSEQGPTLDWGITGVHRPGTKEHPYKDKNGNYRELHTKEAAECIDYHVEKDYRTHYEWKENHRMQVVECPYFTTSVYDLTTSKTIDYSALDSFIIMIGLKGESKLSVDGEETLFRAGDTVLLPATTQKVVVEGTMRFIETYV